MLFTDTYRKAVLEVVLSRLATVADVVAEWLSEDPSHKQLLATVKV